MSAFEKTATEHTVLSGLESYIEDTIEYSDTILSIHNDIADVKQIAEDNHSYAMEHINDEYDRLNADIQSDISSTLGRLDEEIENLKQMIEELQK
jgi:prefoldin subunit 5